MKILSKLFLFAFLGLTITSCNCNREKGQEPTENSSQDIENTTDLSELITVTEKEGSGIEAKSGDRVLVHYEGKLMSNGSVFDSSYKRGQAFEFVLGQGRVIKGWDEGVKGMKKGEVRILKIPSAMGYGTRGAGNVIPPNADLQFKVEMVEIKGSN